MHKWCEKLLSLCSRTELRTTPYSTATTIPIKSFKNNNNNNNNKKQQHQNGVDITTIITPPTLLKLLNLWLNGLHACQAPTRGSIDGLHACQAPTRGSIDGLHACQAPTRGSIDGLHACQAPTLGSIVLNNIDNLAGKLSQQTCTSPHFNDSLIAKN